MSPFSPEMILLIAGIVVGCTVTGYYIATMERPGVMRSRVIELFENGGAIWRKSKYHINPEYKLTLSRKESIQLDEEAEPYNCRKSPNTTRSFPLFILFGKQAVRLTAKQPITNLTKKGTPKDEKDKSVYQKDEPIRIEPLLSPADISAQSERASLRALMSGSLTKTTIIMLVLGLVFGVILGLWASQYLPPPTPIVQPSNPGVTIIP